MVSFYIDNLKVYLAREEQIIDLENAEKLLCPVKAAIFNSGGKNLEIRIYLGAILGHKSFHFSEEETNEIIREIPSRDLEKISVRAYMSGKDLIGVSIS